MNNKEQIEKLVEETISSMDGASRATPAPFLLTRINARYNAVRGNTWERMTAFIARPSVAIAGLCLVILINVLAITNTRSSNNEVTAVADQQQSAADDFSTTVAKVYDIENTEP